MKENRVEWTCPRCNHQNYFLSTKTDGQMIDTCDPDDGGCDKVAMIEWEIVTVANVEVFGVGQIITDIDSAAESLIDWLNRNGKRGDAELLIAQLEAWEPEE